MDSDEALLRLKQGNSRFFSSQLRVKDTIKRRAEVKGGQEPYATIVSCSDSRVVPEYIFDADMGHIFTVRTAGNVVDAIGLGSIEYGVEHLHTPVVVVMGHQFCGAVKATCDSKGESSEGHIKDIVDEVKKAGAKKNYDINATIMENVLCTIEKLRGESGIVSKLEKEGKLKIAGAYYSLESGMVDFFA